MLRFCCEEHEAITFDGEKDACPLCLALDTIEELLAKSSIKAKILKKMDGTTDAEASYNPKLGLYER